MAVDLRCPNCEDNLGKDKENPIVANCGTCGHTFYNPYGDPDSLTDEDKIWIANYKKANAKRNHF